jgi:predicted dehydrogenase
MPSRRTFLKQSAAGAAALSLPAVAPAVLRPERLPVALMGCGGMGSNHLSLLVARKDVEVRYVCDADSKRLADAAKTVAKAGGSPKAEKDIRTVLDDKEVVAVWMATPDHWHSPGAILAADAGKHVYVEKPCSHNVREGRLLVEAAQRNKVMIQVGTQTRSSPTPTDAIERIHGGAIGEILVAKAWNSQLRRNLGKVKPTAPPAELDWALWQGMVPEAPFYSNRVPGYWRYFFDYGAGDMGNDGVHDVDVCVWGLKLDRLPDRLTAMGSKLFFDDDQHWPDTQYMVAEYDPPDGKGRTRQFIYEQRIWSPYVQEGYENGAAFYGTKGMLVIGHSVGWKLYGERNKLIAERTGGVDLAGHHTNFLDAIRSGAKLTAPALAGHVAAGICHLTNISGRLGRALKIDPVKEAILGDDEAHAMLKRKYRDGHWAVPKGV